LGRSSEHSPEANTIIQGRNFVGEKGGQVAETCTSKSGPWAGHQRGEGVSKVKVAKIASRTNVRGKKKGDFRMASKNRPARHKRGGPLEVPAKVPGGEWRWGKTRDKTRNMKTPQEGTGSA